MNSEKFSFNVDYLVNEGYLEKYKHNLYKVLRDFVVFGEQKLYINFGEFLLVYDDVLVNIFCDNAEEIANKNLLVGDK